MGFRRRSFSGLECSPHLRCTNCTLYSLSYMRLVKLVIKKNFMNKCWFKSLLTSLKGFLDVVFVFHDKRIEKDCIKFKFNTFFSLVYVISDSVHSTNYVLCILYSSCAIVIDMLITLQAVQLCDQ